MKKKFGLGYKVNPQKKRKERIRDVLFFLIKFFLIFVLLEFLINLADLTFLRNFIAFLSASFLGLNYSGASVIINDRAFIVTNSCTGLVSSAILGSIIFALKKPDVKDKFLLLFFGSAVLLTINVPRVMLVLVAAQLGFDPELVHEATWFLMSAIILAFWYYTTKKIVGVKKFSALI